MYENNPHQHNPPQYHTIKPSMKKIFLKNIFNIVSAILIVVISLLIIHFYVGLEVFLIPYDALGISINPIQILSNILLVIIGLTAFSIVSNFLLEQHTKYDFYFNKLVAHKSFFFVFTRKIELPYHNIVKVSYSHKGVFNQLFKSGTISIDISGMKHPKFKMEFIDHSEHVARYIHHLLFHYKSYAQHHYNVHHAGHY